MAELKCPHCGQAFTVDDTELSSIVQQIRDKEFEKDISEGKNVDAKDYFPKEVDYSNVFTKSANNISNKIGLVVNSKAKNVWDFIKTLFIS